MLTRKLGTGLLGMFALSAFASIAGAHTVNSVGGLNLRTGPGTGYAVLRVLANGTQVNVVSTYGSWSKIDSPATGWVYSAYLANTPHTSTGTQTYGTKPSGDAAVARIVYNESLRLGASEKVKVALFEACIVESGMRNLTYGHLDSLGVLQIRWRLWGWYTATVPSLSAQWFLRRAIPRQYYYSTSGSLAQAVQVSAYPYRYDQAYWTAKAWLRYLRGY